MKKILSFVNIFLFLISICSCSKTEYKLYYYYKFETEINLYDDLFSFEINDNSFSSNEKEKIKNIIDNLTLYIYFNEGSVGCPDYVDYGNISLIYDDWGGKRFSIRRIANPYMEVHIGDTDEFLSGYFAILNYRFYRGIPFKEEYKILAEQKMSRDFYVGFKNIEIYKEFEKLLDENPRN